jgi:hypothetical protein
VHSVGNLTNPCVDGRLKKKRGRKKKGDGEERKRERRGLVSRVTEITY